MNPERMGASGTDLEIEEEWADLTGDLLSLKSNEDVLIDLFSHALGQWLYFSDLLDDQHEIRPRLTRLEAGCGGALQVTWLGHPRLDRRYCLVLFYVDALDWTNFALYNRARLEERGQVAA